MTLNQVSGVSVNEFVEENSSSSNNNEISSNYKFVPARDTSFDDIDLSSYATENINQQEKQPLNSEIDEIQKPKVMKKNSKKTAPVLNHKTLTFYDSILENDFSIAMFVHRGYDSRFAIAVVFIIHILFASFYGQFKDNMISTVISWSISAAFFIASMFITTVQETDVETEGVSNGTKDIMAVSHSMFYALTVLNYFVYFLVVIIIYEGVSYAQLAIIVLFQLQFVRTFGYLRFIHFKVVCSASFAMFIVLKASIVYVGFYDDLQFGEFVVHGDAILCFLVVVVCVCLTGKYLYHYEYQQRALFHARVNAKDVDYSECTSKQSEIIVKKESVNRCSGGLALEDVGQIIDRKSSADLPTYAADVCARESYMDHVLRDCENELSSDVVICHII